MNKYQTIIIPIFYLIILFTPGGAVAAREISYRIKYGDTIQSIARENFENVKIKYKNNLDGYISDIKNWNPLVRNWDSLKRGEYIYIDYPYPSFISGSTWTPNIVEKESTFNFSFFYAASMGSYTETTNSQIIKTDQNFPITVGFASNFIFDLDNSVATSIYYAEPTKAKINDSITNSTSNFTIPGEVGGNIYYQRNYIFHNLGMYLGYDYEKLNTYNTAQVLNGETLTNITNKIHYATIGCAQLFKFSSSKLSLKASTSFIFSSASSNNQPPLTGNKQILNLSYFPNEIWSLNFFFKHHKLTGATDLSVNRIGAGISLYAY